MVKILHISDLHFAMDAADSNMREVMKNEAREAVAGLPQGSKLLVVTGDFHNYNTEGYAEALRFLNELIVAMDLDRTQDVFVIPGNHDVGNNTDMAKCFPGDPDWSMRKEMAVFKLRSAWPSDKADAERTMPENYLRWRMEAYRPYCEFVKTLGIYPAAQLEADPYQGSEAEEEDGSSGTEENRHEDEYAFMHQNFRDCLAAIHLCNQAETAGDVLPAAWAGHQDTNVLDYVAELMEPEAFQSIWEANRRTKPANHAATATLLELARRKQCDRKETLPELNLSEMDLRGFSLTRYLRKGAALGLFRKPESSEKTELDLASFRSPGHSGSVCCLLVSSAGLVVSGSGDGTLRVWDPATGECLRTLEGHELSVTCVLETKVGQLVSGSRDNTLRVWDPATGACLRRLEGHRGSVTCVMETKGGQLVSGSLDNTLWVWDPATGACLRRLEGHREPVTCVMETKGGQLVSGSGDHTLRIWDPATGKCLRRLEGHERAVNCVLETKGGQLVSGSDDGTLRVWDPATGACLRALKGHRWVVNCVIETKGGQLVSGSWDNTLRVWDPASGACLRTLKGHTNWVSCVIETKGGQLVSGSYDGTLRVWDLSKGIGRECVEVLYPMEAGVSVMGLDFSRASFPEDPAAVLPKMLWQNGATIPGKRSWMKSEPNTE